jgi:hypothetical protein
MKSMIALDRYGEYGLPTLRMHIHGMPHKRIHRSYLQKLREDFTHSAYRQLKLPFIEENRGYKWMIDYNIDINVLYVNPMSEDLDHLQEALHMMMDGPCGSLTGPSILKDDRQIKGYTCRMFHPEQKTKRETERW